MDARDRLTAARLYFICDAAPGGRELLDVLEPALAGGVDIFQLRDKSLGDEQLLELARRAREACTRAGALFILNDRPDLARAAGADGVHVGQRDVSIAAARAAVGPHRIVGVSTHAPDQLAAAGDADYAGVGPVFATPTKPGRPAVGLRYVEHAARASAIPFFAIGGIDAGNAGQVLAAGARRIAVVRAIAQAPDPAAAAAALRAAIDSEVAGAAR